MILWRISLREEEKRNHDVVRRLLNEAGNNTIFTPIVMTAYGTLEGSLPQTSLRTSKGWCGSGSRRPLPRTLCSSVCPRKMMRHEEFVSFLCSTVNFFEEGHHWESCSRISSDSAPARSDLKNGILTQILVQISLQFAEKFYYKSHSSACRHNDGVG